MCTYVFVKVWVEDNSYLPQSLYLIFFETRSSIQPIAHHFSRQVNTQNMPVFIPQHWSYRHVPLNQAFLLFFVSVDLSLGPYFYLAALPLGSLPSPQITFAQLLFWCTVALVTMCFELFLGCLCNFISSLLPTNMFAVNSHIFFLFVTAF